MKTIIFRGKKYQLPEVDSQRARVYASEAEVYGDMWDPNSRWHDYAITDLEQLVDRIACHKFYKTCLREFGRDAITTRLEVRENAKRKGGFCVPGEYIELGRGAMTIPCLIHELAHFVGYYSVLHHWPFAGVYLRMTRELNLLPYDCAYKLRQAFVQQKVKYSKPKESYSWPENPQ